MKTSEETKKNEMKYECIQAACAEAGDEVELFCISDNKQLKFMLPSSDEIETFGLSLYREVISVLILPTRSYVIIIYRQK